MPQGKRKTKPSKQTTLPKRKPAFYIGLILTSVCLFLLFIIFLPAIKSELVYLVDRPDPGLEVATSSFSSPAFPKKNVIVARDKEFAVVVPKIGANSKVVENVDPNNSKEYQIALTRGVAHAKGTSLPDQTGNTFLFAHSSDSFYNANYYNAVFYLLNKMENGDLFYIVYKSQIFKYKVIKVAVVDSSATTYYTNAMSKEKTASLMTCWPPATTLKRLVVVGALQQ